MARDRVALKSFAKRLVGTIGSRKYWASWVPFVGLIAVAILFSVYYKELSVEVEIEPGSEESIRLAQGKYLWGSASIVLGLCMLWCGAVSVLAVNSFFPELSFKAKRWTIGAGLAFLLLAVAGLYEVEETGGVSGGGGSQIISNITKKIESVDLITSVNNQAAMVVVVSLCFACYFVANGAKTSDRSSLAARIRWFKLCLYSAGVLLVVALYQIFRLYQWGAYLQEKPKEGLLLELASSISIVAGLLFSSAMAFIFLPPAILIHLRVRELTVGAVEKDYKLKVKGWLVAHHLESPLSSIGGYIAVLSPLIIGLLTKAAGLLIDARSRTNGKRRTCFARLAVASRWAAGVPLRQILLIGLTLAVAASGPAAPAHASDSIQGGYSTEPLKEPVFEVAQVAVDSAAFNNWLNSNYSSLTAETMKGPREHLYYLIGSWVSSIYKREGVVLPSDYDLLLQNLYSWSERLGVFGGNLVYNAIKTEQAPALPSHMPVPDEFSLSLRKDMLTLESKRGEWTVAIPYYFMIWNLSEFDAKEGPRTQLVSISTAASTHEGLDGHSQATLMLLAGPGADPAEFETYWRAGLGFAGDEPFQELPVSDLKSRRRFDAAANVHSEYTTWQTKSGPILVAYMGMNGTYQSNRPNFIDFLRSLRD